MKTLVSYVRRPCGPLFHDYDNRNKFVNAVMKEFKGAKAKTPVEKLVKSYINNQKVGVIMAIPEDTGQVNITYAQWDDGKDVYDKGMMLAIAMERAERFADKPDSFVPKVPFDIAEALPAFMARAKRYYKDGEFPKWTDQYVPLEIAPEVLKEVEEVCGD
jgi:hypothetical protein